MKTNNIYISVTVAVAVIILGFVLFSNREKTDEANDETALVATSTPTDTQSTNNTKNTSPARTPAPSSNTTNVSKPVETPAQEPVPSIPSLSDLNGSIFRLTSYNGNVIPSESRYILSFEEGSLSAKFCNNLSGNFVLDGSLIKASNLNSTKMYCASPANLMEIETEFASILNSGSTLQQSGNTIILSHLKGVVMVFKGF